MTQYKVTYDVINVTSPKLRHQNFPLLGSSVSKILIAHLGSLLENIKSTVQLARFAFQTNKKVLNRNTVRCLKTI